MCIGQRLVGPRRTLVHLFTSSLPQPGGFAVLSLPLIVYVSIKGLVTSFIQISSILLQL